MVDEDPKVRKMQWEIYKKMTPAEKWQVVEELRAAAWTIKAAAVRSAHPDWAEEQVEARVKEIFLYAST